MSASSVSNDLRQKQKRVTIKQDVYFLNVRNTMLHVRYMFVNPAFGLKKQPRVFSSVCLYFTKCNSHCDRVF